MNILAEEFTARSEAEFQHLIRARPPVPALLRDLLSAPAESPRHIALHAAYFFAGALHNHGFTLFFNGGRPLLMRVSGDLVQELLVVAPGTAIRGAYVPIYVQIHVSSPTIERFREQIWERGRRGAMRIASANLGLFADPPASRLWNLASETSRPHLLARITRLLAKGALPWMDLLANPDTLTDSPHTQRTLLPPDSLLEFLLVSCGPAPAEKALVQILDADPALSDAFHSFSQSFDLPGGPKCRQGHTAWNLAVLAYRHGLSAQRTW